MRLRQRTRRHNRSGFARFWRIPYSFSCCLRRASGPEGAKDCSHGCSTGGVSRRGRNPWTQYTNPVPPQRGGGFQSSDQVSPRDIFFRPLRGGILICVLSTGFARRGCRQPAPPVATDPDLFGVAQAASLALGIKSNQTSDNSYAASQRSTLWSGTNGVKPYFS